MVKPATLNLTKHERCTLRHVLILPYDITDYEYESDVTKLGSTVASFTILKDAVTKTLVLTLSTELATGGYNYDLLEIRPTGAQKIIQGNLKVVSTSTEI
jgi:hypothetical protein